MASQEAGEVKMVPTLGLTGVTINAMALIAPGAFLWTTYQLQANPASAMNMWFSVFIATAIALLTATAYAAAAALYFLERGRKEVHAGNLRTWSNFKVPEEAIGCGFHEAVRGLLSHHLVIRKGRIANYHPYPPTPWNASPRDSFGTPGPYEDAIQGSPLFEENGPESFKGIDIMRTVRSFDPCLPCGVHMMLGDGKVLEVRHSPTFGAQIGGPP